DENRLVKTVVHGDVDTAADLPCDGLDTLAFGADRKEHGAGEIVSRRGIRVAPVHPAAELDEALVGVDDEHTGRVSGRELAGAVADAGIGLKAKPLKDRVH